MSVTTFLCDIFCCEDSIYSAFHLQSIIQKIGYFLHKTNLLVFALNRTFNTY